MHGRSRMTIRPSHPCNAGTEHVGFSPTRQALLAPSAKTKTWKEDQAAASQPHRLSRATTCERTRLAKVNPKAIHRP